MLPSGVQATYKNRIGWAHDRLKRAGLSACPRRGFWCLTEEGFAYVATHPALSPSDIAGLIHVDTRSSLRSRFDEGEPVKQGTPSLVVNDATHESPEDRIESALVEVREAVARDLLEIIGRAPPEFFEQLVLELLLAMGYGANRDALQRVGGTSDGGIDGIISLDRLGLEKVYVQAKRWKSTVGSPEVQGFMGALQLQGAAKGVFITTSLFTREAKAAATKARGSIVLVDGAQLAELMMDHGVGVSHKAIRVPRVDHDYFEDG